MRSKDRNRDNGATILAPTRYTLGLRVRSTHLTRVAPAEGRTEGSLAETRQREATLITEEEQRGREKEEEDRGRLIRVVARTLMTHCMRSNASQDRCRDEVDVRQEETEPVEDGVDEDRTKPEMAIETGPGMIKMNLRDGAEREEKRGDDKKGEKEEEKRGDAKKNKREGKKGSAKKNKREEKKGSAKKKEREGEKIGDAKKTKREKKRGDTKKNKKEKKEKRGEGKKNGTEMESQLSTRKNVKNSKDPVITTGEEVQQEERKMVLSVESVGEMSEKNGGVKGKEEDEEEIKEGIETQEGKRKTTPMMENTMRTEMMKTKMTETGETEKMIQIMKKASVDNQCIVWEDQ